MTTPLLPPSGTLRLVVFDWDGTLMDSPRRIVHCLRRAAERTGAPVRGEGELRSIIGLGVEAAVRQLYPEADPDFVWRFATVYRELYLGAADAPETPLYSGTIELLDWLESRDVLLAVATSKSRPGLDQALEKSALSGRFLATATSDEYPSKPHPAMLAALMECAGVEPAYTRMVGDSVYDLQMAQQAGVPAIAITHGVHGGEQLAAERPLELVPDLSTLLHRWQNAEMALD
jgi:phosphoglycolate phosphatase